ncbi:MAG TPA: hypothetical protein VG709_01410 [Actinomycetota bacterium]|nr:hypothetical protein [Actinomycetota bacterium]
MTTRKMLGAAAAMLLVVAMGVGPAAGQTSTDVSLAALTGSRTLIVTTPTGANLDGGELDLGTSHTGGFVTSVADVNYDHVGYQVSSTLSNLYLFAGSFDCNKRVDSDDLAVSFPIDAQVHDIGAIVNGLVDVEGTVNGGLATLLDPTGAINTVLTTAGLDPLAGRPLVAGDLTAQLEDTLNGVFDGADSLLPVNLSNGPNGSFAEPAAHPNCGGGAGTPTSRLLMSGEASGVGGFVQGLIADLEALVDGVSLDGLVSGGVVDAAAAQAAAAAAVQDLEDAINAELAGLSLAPIALPQTSDVVDLVLERLIGALDLANLIGQTGLGVSLPNLDATPDSAPVSGVYKGRMVVTLVDVPS